MLPKRQRPYSVPTSFGTLHSAVYDSSSVGVGSSDPVVQRRPSTSQASFVMGHNASMVGGAPQQQAPNMRRRTIVFPADNSTNLPLDTKAIPSSANRFRSGSMPPIHETSKAFQTGLLHHRTSLEHLSEVQHQRMQAGFQSGVPNITSLPRSQITSRSPLSPLARNGAMNGMDQATVRIRKPGVSEGVQHERPSSDESNQNNGSAWWPIAVATFPAAISMFTGTVSMWGELMVLAVLTAFLYQVIRVPTELYNSLNDAGKLGDSDIKTTDVDFEHEANETTPRKPNLEQAKLSAIRSARQLRTLYLTLMLVGPFFGAYAMFLTQRWLVYFKPYITEHTLILFVCSALTRPLSLAISSVHAHNDTVVHRVAGTAVEARVAELESTVIALRESLANSRRDMESAVREGVEPTIEKLAKHVRKVEKKEETILKLVEERVEGLESRLRVWEDLWDPDHLDQNEVPSKAGIRDSKTKTTNPESTSQALIFSDTNSIPSYLRDLSDDEDRLPGTPNTLRRMISDTEDEEIVSSTSTVSPLSCARNTSDIGVAATICEDAGQGGDSPARANLSPAQTEQFSPVVSSPSGAETLVPSTRQIVRPVSRSPAVPDSALINATVDDEDAKNESKPGLWGLMGTPSEMASVALRVGSTALSSIVRGSPRKV
ncbi:hypothetical protein BJ742DRAFT_188200 [Cladochytrium replicatum]|nr:hypothetical protein BJ742DRAFT_188200 [Cladochytrium replicatum]